MKRTTTIMVSALFVLMTSSGCVWQSDFDEFVEEVRYQHEILACEARVDAYEARQKSDEPDPTRRDEPLARSDEPSGTRRDLETCLEEFDRVVGGSDPSSNYQKCKPEMQTCVEDTNHGFPQCNQCFDDCMASANGTWPDGTCPLP